MLGHQSEYSSETFRGQEFGDIELTKLEFYDCTFLKCRFTETILNQCRLYECTFRECDINQIRVTDSSFREVRFERSQVIAVNWAEAAWAKEGLLNSIHFTDRCVLNYSTFIGLKLHDLQLSDCIARHVDFAEADLTNANFRGTDLTDTRFLHTDLTEADFTGAFNYAINASLNTLKQTRFSLPEALSLLHALDIVLVEEDIHPDS